MIRIKYIDGDDDDDDDDDSDISAVECRWLVEYDCWCDTDCDEKSNN